MNSGTPVRIILNYRNKGMRTLLIALGVFCFSVLSAQKQITGYMADIKESNTISYVGQFENTAIFSTRVNTGHYLLFPSGEKIDSVKVGLKAEDVAFTIAGGKIWAVPLENETTIYSLAGPDAALREEAVIASKDGITWSGKFLYYNKGSRYYAYDLSLKKEAEVFDESGYFTKTHSGAEIQEGFSMTVSGSRFAFPNGWRFDLEKLKETKEPEVIRLRREGNYYAFWVRDYADSTIHLYLLNGDETLYRGKVSPDTDVFISTSKGMDYLIQTDEKQNLRIAGVLTGSEIMNINIPLNLYFTSTTVFGGQRTLVYSKPVIVNGALYVLGANRRYDYLDGISPGDFYLCAVELNEKIIRTYNAAPLVPQSRFKNLVTMSAPEMYHIDSSLTFTYGSEYLHSGEYIHQVEYQFTSGTFEKSSLETREKVPLYPVSDGFLSFDNHNFTLWTPDKKVRETRPFPEFRRKISGFHNYQKGQELLWISHFQEDGLAISTWDGHSLKIIKEGIKYSSSEKTVIGESENRISNRSIVLLRSEKESRAYFYDYSSGSLSLLAEGLNMHFPGSAFRVEELTDGSFIIKSNYSGYYTYYRVKNNTITDLPAVAFTPSGWMTINGKGLVYRDLNDDNEIILSANPYSTPISGKTHSYFVDSGGFYKVDQNGVKVTIEPFRSGLSPRLIRVSDRYLVCRISGKMYLTDLETGVSEPVNLPYENYEGFSYFQQGNKIIGLSGGGYGVYSYDVLTRNFKTLLKDFNTGNGGILPGSRCLFYYWKGKTEIWEVTDGEIKKIHDYYGERPPDYLPDKVILLKSEKGFVYWNPQKNLVLDMEGEDLSGYQWIDSLGNKQLFEKNRNQVFSFDEVTRTWQLLNPSENTAWVQASLKVGNNMYFKNADYEVWQTNGTAAGTRKIPGVRLSREFRDSLTDYKGKLYFIAGNSLRQLWEADHKEIDMPLATEKPGISFSIYPNPVTEILNIRTDREDTEIYKFQLFSENGRLLQTGPGSFPHRLSLKEYPPGIYFVRINGQKRSETFRVLKY